MFRERSDLHSVWTLVAVATLVANAAAVSWYLAAGPNPPSAILFFGMAFAQMCLICIWLVFGAGPWVVRAVAPFIVLAGVVLLLTVQLRNMGHAVMVIGLPFVSLLLIFALMRLMGISPSRCASVTEMRREMRFSVRRLFGWMTFAAVAATASTWADFRDAPIRELPTFLMIADVVPVACVSCCWGLRSLPMALCLSISLSCIAAPIIYWLLPRLSGTSTGEMMALNLVQAAVLLPWLSVWRITARARATSHDTNRIDAAEEIE